MPPDAIYEHLLERACRLAETALTLSNPNPRVGCVIADAAGQVLGEGYTQQAGGPHAEVMALRDAAAQGLPVQGATAYVTLEPCAHQGRTGPCCEALIAAGIEQVVVATQDPNPLVAGRGVQRLRAAGVAVQVLGREHALARATRELNIGFFSRMLRGTPWVRLKMAASLDGTSALAGGASQWITGPAARADGHAWRARACAVLTGIGTVLQDNPRLDVRDVPTTRQPHLVVVDSRLQTPANARLLEPAASGQPRQVWIFSAENNPTQQAALAAKGAQVIHMPGSPDAAGQASSNKVDLSAMLRELGRREINELHVEAGSKLNGSLLRAGLVDECLLYLAPKLLGAGQGLADIGPLNQLSEAIELDVQSIDCVGEDIRLLARVSGRGV